MDRPRSRTEALAGFARCIAEGMRIRDSLSVEEAARRAYCAGGPSISELEHDIRALRAGREPVHRIAA
jgi:hypothetical protein